MVLDSGELKQLECWFASQSYEVQKPWLSINRQQVSKVSYEESKPLTKVKANATLWEKMYHWAIPFPARIPQRSSVQHHFHTCNYQWLRSFKGICKMLYILFLTICSEKNTVLSPPHHSHLKWWSICNSISLNVKTKATCMNTKVNSKYKHHNQ